ncbi:hypothetical protein [Bradyrhizobium sp. 23]|uniref:hypothetical protein n=1 Tax=Bradyrhizobium sp. 23 TaxID=2782667 RepID=UPI001FF98823|nr:hypothetical protein [Bradyrhizobium sp. 23]MCK1314972.1 hypothetical protein [Bradyrhizobium sp. 23]
MVKPPSKASSRGQSNQVAEIRRLQRRIANGGLLQFQKTGGLEIDNFASDFGNGNKQFLRDAVEQMGRLAVQDFSWSFDLLSGARDFTKRTLHEIEKVDKAGLWLRGLDQSMMMNLHVGLSARDGRSESVDLELDAIIEAVQLIHRSNETLKQDFEVSRPLVSGRSEVLANAFVRSMLAFHRDQLGRPAPKARTGRFAEFMQAAWDDLGFPKLAEDTLGNLAERLPRLMPKDS